MRAHLRVLALVAFVASCAFERTDSLAPDAADVDAPAVDAAPDATMIDAAMIDAATIDAATIDAATIDAANVDGPAVDAPPVDAPTVVLLTVNRNGNGAGTVTGAGIDCGSDCTEEVTPGTTIVLTAAATGTSTFTGWSGGGCSGTGTCAVTLNASTAVTATFVRPNHTLTVMRGGTGSGTVVSSPAGIDCGGAGACTSSFVEGTLVSLTPTPAANSNFIGWSGACTGTGACQVPMTMAQTVSATFALETFTVMVTRTGAIGTVTSSPAGINCGADCAETYVIGTMITLTATPGSGNAFTGWSGGSCSGTGTCAFSVTSNVTIDAAFANNTLTVVRTGNGTGTVSSSPAGINCGTDCLQDYDVGTIVMLIATTAAGARFTGWTGGGCSGTASCPVTMNGPTSIIADFIDTYVLTLNKTGSGSGSVTSNPAGITCGTACTSTTATYDDNTVVTLTAVGATGSRFTGWSGSGCSGTGTCTVTMANTRTVTATFMSEFPLAVTRSGTGSALGTVQSSPSGIDCGTDCSEPYIDGTSVTLSASTTGGATFTSWSGVAGCTTSPTCIVTMTQARNVTATFAAP